MHLLGSLLLSDWSVWKGPQRTLDLKKERDATEVV